MRHEFSDANSGPFDPTAELKDQIRKLKQENARLKQRAEVAEADCDRLQGILDEQERQKDLELCRMAAYFNAA